jgi:hypothetical protein
MQGKNCFTRLNKGNDAFHICVHLNVSLRLDDFGLSPYEKKRSLETPLLF